MIRIVHLLFFLTYSSSILCQTSGIVHYNTRLLYGNLSVRVTETDAELKFKDSVSLFTYRKAFLSSTTSPNAKLIKEIFQLEISGSSARKNIIELDSIGFQVYHNYDTDELIYRESSSWKPYIIKEEIQGPHWTLIDSTSHKYGHKSKMAKCYFRGRNYTAWYTEEIGLPIGPWKLHGLPGLIVEAESESGEVLFYITDIEYRDDFEIEEPLNGEEIRFKEYWKQYLIDYSLRVDFLREQSSGADSIRRSRGATGDYFREPMYFDNIDIPPFTCKSID